MACHCFAQIEVLSWLPPHMLSTRPAAARHSFCFVDRSHSSLNVSFFFFPVINVFQTVGDKGNLRKSKSTLKLFEPNEDGNKATNTSICRLISTVAVYKCMSNHSTKCILGL